MAEDKDSRTEAPTSKRLTEAREKGQVAKSQEVNTFILLSAATVFLSFFTLKMMEGIIRLWREVFSAAAEFEINPTSAHYLLKGIMEELGGVALPFMATLALVGLAANYWQNDGWMLSFHPLAPKWSKLNPLSGMKKIVGKEGLMNLFKSLGKLAIVSVAVWIAMKDELLMLPPLLEASLEETLSILGGELLMLFVRALGALAIIAFIDYSYQKWSFTDNMKMTKTEVKDEHKQQDGDPITKMRIRQRQYDMHRNRMMQAVPEAEVIITNPTHLSIALRYDRLRDPAPVVVAKGAGYLALRIREIGKEHDIVMVEDKPLAQTLFKNVDIGEQVPESLYKAVADTLAYVYRLKKKAI
jgi:flagellar biosynthetic protein FlhB